MKEGNALIFLSWLIERSARDGLCRCCPSLSRCATALACSPLINCLVLFSPSPLFNGKEADALSHRLLLCQHYRSGLGPLPVCCLGGSLRAPLCSGYARLAWVFGGCRARLAGHHERVIRSWADVRSTRKLLDERPTVGFDRGYCLRTFAGICPGI